MVIISTSATELSIQAVSPEFGVHFSSTAFFGSASATQAGGGAEASGAGAAAAGALAAGRAVWEWECLSVALLAPLPFDLRDRQPVHADRGQRIAHLVQLERLDHRHDDFHGFLSPLRSASDCPELGRTNEHKDARQRRAAREARGTYQG